MRFVDFAQAHGLIIHDLHPVTRIQRCPTIEKPHAKNGAWFWDGERGWCFAWDGEAKVQWFGSDSKPWTDEEKREWAQRRNGDRVKIETNQKKSAQRASALLETAKISDHGYLQIKGFPAEVGMVAHDALLIPMRNVSSNELQGVQSIAWNEPERTYDKKMFPGMKAKAGIFRMGNKTAPETILCEGYATGLSIYHAVRSVGFMASVLVCFSAGNIEHVAPMVKGRAFVFADHDKSGRGEQAAINTGLSYCMSDVVGQDANDLHIESGLFSVSRKIMEMRRT